MTWQVEEGEDIGPATDLNILTHARCDVSHKMSSPIFQLKFIKL